MRWDLAHELGDWGEEGAKSVVGGLLGEGGGLDDELLLGDDRLLEEVRL